MTTPSSDDTPSKTSNAHRDDLNEETFKKPPPTKDPESSTVGPDFQEAATIPPTGQGMSEDPTLAPDKENHAQNDHSAGPSMGQVASGFGDYELLEEIARGGMGVVYRARQRSLNRVVALKMILAGQLAGEQEVQRFRMEAESAAHLDHPGIVPIHEVGEHQGQHYFSMGLVDGESLANKLKSGPLPRHEAAKLTRRVAEAISYAHQQGVIHRDLKPANILLEKDGQPKVTDFGLAKKVEVDSGLTATGQVLGTPGFMPPEQAGGDSEQIGPLADVYSLGAILYNSLTGRPPFQAGSVMDTLLQVLEQDPVPPRQLNNRVDRDLETICLKCLEKDPHRRYGSAEELAQDLGRYLNDEPIEARRTSAAYKLWRKVKKNRVTSLAIVAAMVAVMVGGGIFWQLHRTRKELAQKEAGIQQLVVIPFRNLSGNSEDDWLGAGFASVLESKLSGIQSLKVIGKGRVEGAVAELGLAGGQPLDDAAASQLGGHLLVNHVILGEFQRAGDQIHVSAKVVNVQTGAIDQGGIEVSGNFSDIFRLQADLAGKCFAQLGVETSGTGHPPQVNSQQVTTATDPPTRPEVSQQPAASVEAWVLFGKGQHALENRDLDEAIRLLSQAVERDPKLWKAYRALGLAYEKSVRIADAVGAFRKALAINPNDLVSSTYYNFLTGRNTKGLAALEKAQNAGLADLEMQKMLIQQKAGWSTLQGAKSGGEEVANEIQALLEKHPRDSDLWIMLATHHKMANQPQDAIRVLQQGLEAAPNSYVLHLWLSLTYEDQGRKEDAARELTLAEKFRPKGVRGFREFAAFCLMAGKSQRAIGYLERALKAEPENATVHMLLGQSYFATDVSRSMEHFEKAFQYDPHSTLVLAALCQLANVLQQNDRLTKYALKWTQVAPESFEARQHLRFAYLKTGQIAKARQQEQVLAKLTPTNAGAYFMRGNSLIQARQWQEAISVLSQGLKEFPDNTGIAGLLHLAQAMPPFLQGKWEQAIAPLEKSAAEMPGIPDATLMLTICYENTGRPAQAAEQAKKLIDTFPYQRIIAFDPGLNRVFRIFKLAKKYDYGIELARKAVQSTPADPQMHKRLLEFSTLAGRWDEAQQLVDGLRASTIQECRLRIEVGLEWINQLAEAGKIEKGDLYNQRVKFFQQTRRQAIKDGLVETGFLDAMQRWKTIPQKWLIVGPFVGGRDFQGLDRVYPPEQNINPDTWHEVVGGKATWSLMRRTAGDYIDLTWHLGRLQGVVAYAVTYIESPIEQQVQLQIGSDDGVKVWLNDELVLEQKKHRRFQQAEDKVTATLRKGANKLLVKIDQGTGNWGFSLNAVDSKGWPALVHWLTDPDRVRARAHVVVHGLSERLRIKSDVIGHLQSDSSLSEPLRGIAIEFAQKLRDDYASMLGTWTLVSTEEGGRKQPSPPNAKVVITKDKIVASSGEKDLFAADYKLDVRRDPGWIDLVDEGKTMRGIYQLEKNTLRICANEKADGQRSRRFESKPGTEDVLMILRRDKR